MIDLKQACDIVLSEHPEKYIHVVNEYDSVYAFVLLRNGERIEDVNGVLLMTTVNKTTGKITNGLFGVEDMFQGNYKQYTHADILN